MLPHLTLALSTPIPKLMVATITSTLPCIQSFCTSVRSPAFKPEKTQTQLRQNTFSSLTHKYSAHTCMIRLGNDSKLRQLVSHSFTAFSGSTVNNPTALPPTWQGEKKTASVSPKSHESAGCNTCKETTKENNLLDEIRCFLNHQRWSLRFRELKPNLDFFIEVHLIVKLLLNLYFTREKSQWD